MNFKIIKICILGLFCSDLVLAAEQGGKRRKPAGKSLVNQETEDEMLDRLAREHAPAVAAAEAKQKANTASALRNKKPTRAEVLTAIDYFLQNCKPNACTVTQTGTVLTDSKKCNKSQLDSILQEAMGLNLNAIESLMNLAVACKMTVSKTFSVQQNFAALYTAATMRPQLTSPHTVCKYVSDTDSQHLTPLTCDPRFLRLIDSPLQW